MTVYLKFFEKYSPLILFIILPSLGLFNGWKFGSENVREEIRNQKVMLGNDIIIISRFNEKTGINI